MTSEEQKIIDIKVKYEDAIYGIIRFQEKLNDLTKTQKQLDEQLEKGEISWNEYALQTEAANAATKQYKENIRVLRKEMQNNLKTEQEQEGSLKSMRAQLSNLTKAYSEMSKAERDSAKGKELQNHINALTDDIKEVEEGIQLYQRSVGNYKNAITEAIFGNSRFGASLQAIVDMAGKTDGLIGQLSTRIGAFKTTVLGLFTNPYFLSMAGVAGAGMAFKWWYDYNQGLMEASRLTTEFTGKTGTEMQALRDRILALSSAMGTDFKDTLATVDFLMAQFGLTAEEAAEVVKDGFAAGANLSGDMLSKLQRYAPAFKDMGLSAKELAAILAQTRSGIFTDAGVDAIQMAGKKLREMSTTTAQALRDVGIDADEMTRKMSDGSMTGFEAVQQVSMALAKLGGNSREAGQIMKEVFGKNSVAAGQELIKSLAVMTTDIEEVKKQTGEWGKQQEQLIAANEELRNVTAALFDVTDNGFEGVINQAKIVAMQSLTGIMKGVVKLTNYVIRLYNESALFRGLMELIAVAFKAVWSVAKGVFNLISEGFKGIGMRAKAFLKILEGVLSLDLEKTRKGFNELFSSFAKTWSNIGGDMKQMGVDLWDAVKTGWNNSVNGNELKRIEIPEMGVPGDTLSPSEITTQPTSKTQPQNHGAAKSTAKTITKATADEEKRAAEERKRQEQELQAAILRVQMDYQIKMMQAKKMYLAGLYESDEAYQKDVNQLQQEEVARMLDVYVQAGVIGEQKALEMQQKLLDLQIQFKSQLEQEAAKMAETWRKEFEAEEQERKRQLLDQGILEKQNNVARLERYKAFLEEKKKAFQDNAMALAELDKQAKEAESERENAEYEEKGKNLQDYKNTMMGYYAALTSALDTAFQEMFANEEVNFKAFLKSMLVSFLDFIEKRMTAGYVAILTDSVIESGWAGFASAAAKYALVTAAFEAAKAAVKSFAVGGYVSGAGTSTSDSIPARLSNGESVMNARATSMFSPLLSAFNQLGGGVPIMVPNNTGTQIGEDFLAAAIAKGFMMCPRPVVSVEEITQLQERVKVIEGRGQS